MNRKVESAITVYKKRKEARTKTNKKSAKSPDARSPGKLADKRQRRKRCSDTPQKNGKVRKEEQCAVYDGLNGSTSSDGSEAAKSIVSGGSELAAARCFDWLIQPVERERFFRELWEKKPMLVRRHQSDFYQGLMSCNQLDRILRERSLFFTENIDLTTYEGGKRETHNPDGRAHAAVVWDAFQKGCSVRLLNPQTYSRAVWRLCSVLQEFFGSFVGANMYLTPAGSQGFAPHYDDIEAFVVQLEGRKCWRLYAPRDPSEELPRFSSENFSPEEVGEPILEAVLEPGDLLYFPRGIIHQAYTPDDVHSLHLTLSTCQRNTWGDLFERMIPQAVQLAMEEDVEYRKSLPRGYLNYMGVANADVASDAREAFLGKVRHLVEKLVNYCPVDAAVDQCGKAHLHEALPPLLSQEERRRSVHTGEHWRCGQVVNVQELDPDVQVRLARRNAVRLVVEEQDVRLYHSFDNSRRYKGRDPQWILLEEDQAPAVEALLHAYPGYLKVDDLPLDNPLDRLELASLLYDKGLLITKQPLEIADD
ncbi:bifunctional lysine-specific demethylase and histidyl-hydroxylase NO66-like [Dermacentor variabilis]|uniref:bifunctional lysine-specific demethylase and histidyl-hydroxylase NO66-like n=1 Tax=Dermacentor variabilis TaxID=34621 RepID=UPI003F5BAFC5